MEDRQNVERATAPPAKAEPTAGRAQDASEETQFISTGSKALHRRVQAIDDDEPLIDTTVSLPKRSKKTERATKRWMKRQQRAARRRGAATLADLPAELLEEILSYLRASDILALLPVNRSIHAFVTDNEPAIARSVIRRRYAVLAQCFPLPRPLSSVPESAHQALLSDARQNLIQMHKRAYQHVQPIDADEICTCMTCTLAWNNLVLIADLAHWQRNLQTREPIPMIPRGQQPDWNQALLAQNAAVVETAMVRPLFYALLLQRHLETTVGTLARTLRGQKTVHPKRVFQLSRAEAEAGIETDVFLERNGPECHEFPYHRDNYYNLNAYVPNRKWLAGEQRWAYYAAGSHERDLAWVVERFEPEIGGARGRVEGERSAKMSGQERARADTVQGIREEEAKGETPAAGEEARPEEA